MRHDNHTATHPNTSLVSWQNAELPAGNQLMLAQAAAAAPAFSHCCRSRRALLHCQHLLPAQLSRQTRLLHRSHIALLQQPYLQQALYHGWRWHPVPNGHLSASRVAAT